MFFGEDLTSLAFVFMAAVAAGGFIIALVYPMLSGSRSAERLKAFGANKSEVRATNLKNRLAEDAKDGRRKQLQEVVSQIENSAKEKKKKLTLKAQLDQCGLEITVKMFWLISVIVGIVLGLALYLIGTPLIAAVLAMFVGIFGLPRWFLGHLRKRRINVFLNDFADAIDVMVRGLKSGLPVTEALKIIATEMREPVGPEFQEVVDGQRIGISLEQGIERMAERVPLAEVNFLAIVMAIQAKTGGNLSEALGNLSKVLRERRKMKMKIASVSQEAKSSAAIIGSLPFLLIGAIHFMTPNYLMPMFNTTLGNIWLAGAGLWMLTGMLVMKKMINFEI